MIHCIKGLVKQINHNSMLIKTMFQLSKITFFLQEADELTDVKDHPSQGSRGIDQKGNCPHTQESLETMQSCFHNVLCGAVKNKSLVVLRKDRALSDLQPG